MRKAMRSAVVAPVLAAGILSGPVVSLQGQAAQAVQVSRPAFHGKETFKIVTVRFGERRPTARAWGAFRGKGVFIRRLGTLDFQRGRIKVRRHVTSTSHRGPNLSTCRFTIWVNGTFRVVRATGRFRGLRESGVFRSTLHGQYNSTGPTRCGSRLVHYHVVTYETGFAR